MDTFRIIRALLLSLVLTLIGNTVLANTTDIDGGVPGISSGVFLWNTGQTDSHSNIKIFSDSAFSNSRTNNLGSFPGKSDSRDNFLGGAFSGRFSSIFGNRWGAGLGVEAGPRNYRASGTIGTALNCCHHQLLKLTGEYLWQKIDYGFQTGNVKHWVDQIAVGLAYEFVPIIPHIASVEFAGYYSHAPNHHLSSVIRQSTVNNIPVTTTNERRIAGSDAGGGSATLHLNLWKGDHIGLALNYDNVDYHTRFSHHEHPHGFGGTGTIMQYFGRHFRADFSGAYRQPFDSYRVGADWVHPGLSNEITVGVFGSYVDGKHRLPDTSLVGVNLTYTLGGTPKTAPGGNPHTPINLRSWINKPAVYMPQVLTIADERTTEATKSLCEPLIIKAVIPDNLDVTGPVTIQLGNFFQGTGLTYMAQKVPPVVGPFWTFTFISPDLLRVAWDDPPGHFNVATPLTDPTLKLEITATDQCGVSKSQEVTFVVQPS